MNSEELEQSLRTEFESYLKTVQAEMKQDVAEFQASIEAEFDKHRAQTSEAFQGFAARFDSTKEVDEGFRQLVAEHLKLARDEGAKLSATAYAEAEKLDAENAAVAAASAPAPANFAEIRDAITDISSKDSQSTILKSLVEQAAKFAPRGAFFIIKSEHFVGWKVFGEEADADESTVRDIHFATSKDSILGKSVNSKTTAEAAFGAHSDDTTFLDPLNFGHPDSMYAIPLVARGRAVAVMYADKGSGSPVNLEALETLVSVAGLTVELLASAQTAKADDREMAAADFEDSQSSIETPSTNEHVEPVSPFASEAEPSQFNFSDSVSYSGGFPAEAPLEEAEAVTEADAFEKVENAEPAAEFERVTDFEPVSDFETAETVEKLETFTPVAEPYAVEEEEEEEPAAEDTYQFEETPAAETHIEPETVSEPEIIAEESETKIESEPEDEIHTSEETFVEPVHGFETSSGAVAFDNGDSAETSETLTSPFEAAVVEPFAPAGTIGGGFEPAVETLPVVEVTTPPVQKARLSDRPVDLPIEVPEEERRLHNDARRFARLLVSEIKLYNEKKVLEGRDAHDLYERLREAIDRSREMYDKRVQPPVAARFDYFHYELLNSLAEGNAENFGNGYPGATV